MVKCWICLEEIDNFLKTGWNTEKIMNTRTGDIIYESHGKCKARVDQYIEALRDSQANAQPSEPKAGEIE